jgi:hypothetical protein
MDTTRAPTRPRHPRPPQAPGLGAELRESLLLLGFALGVTVGSPPSPRRPLSALA